MRKITSVILLLVYLKTSGQVGPIRNWVYTEENHIDAKANLVTFTHSFPKGGGQVNSNGQKYGYVVFWNRVFNQSTNPLELQVKFPDVTFFKSPNSYIKIRLPKEMMNHEKIQFFDYGLTNLHSVLNDESSQLGVLSKKINPKEDYLFYIAVFIHIELSGPARASFLLKDQDLFYKISMGSDTTLIPCGSLIFKN